MRGPILDAEKILAVLQRHEVAHVVVGALAATFHGSPLRTDDIDICPDPAPTNIKKLVTALQEMGAKEWDPRKEDVIESPVDEELLAGDRFWMFATRFGDLDVLLEPAGTGGYPELVKRAITFKLDDLEVVVASLPDIIRSKEAAGREKDLHQLPTLRRLLDESLKE